LNFLDNIESISLAKVMSLICVGENVTQRSVKLATELTQFKFVV